MLHLTCYRARCYWSYAHVANSTLPLPHHNSGCAAAGHTAYLGFSVARYQMITPSLCAEMMATTLQ